MPVKTKAQLLAENEGLLRRIDVLERASARRSPASGDRAEARTALQDVEQQQAATSAILRALRSMPTDLQPVLNAVVENAARLSASNDALIRRADGGSLRRVAHFGSLPEPPSSELHPIVSASAGSRAFLERRVIHVEDIVEEFRKGNYLDGRALQGPIGYRTVLAVPLLRQDTAIGVILIRRMDARPFSDKQIELLKTFADQAVIAIENVRLFNEIEEKSRQLEAASRHKSEFLANMSHELRTPLNAIIGFSEVLSEQMFGEINDKQAEYLHDILESGRHLLSLINDILDLSKIEAGRMDLEPTDFSLPAAIDNALTLVRERAHRHGITLGRDVDERLGVVRADERKVKQVLLNLLSNALKFTPDGGRIDVRAGVCDGVAEVSVSDTGIGIAPEDQSKVFDEFQQVGTASKKVEGTGLGLAISRKFIELHGGRIWVESQVGVGSTFAFTLPLTIDQPPKVLPAHAATNHPR